MKGVLCMFSGGVDSTGVLHRVLTHKDYADYKVYVHHIHIINRENRAKAENISVNKTISYYKKNGSKEFNFFSSTFNLSGLKSVRTKRFPFDMDVCAFYAANICASIPEIELVAMGRTLTDIGSGGANFMLRMNRAQAIFRATLLLQEGNPNYIFPVQHLTKKEIYQTLPAEVQASVWYCRRPIYLMGKPPQPCNQCPTCRDMKEVLKN